MEKTRKNVGNKMFMAGALLAGSLLTSSLTNTASAFSFSHLGTGAEVRSALGEFKAADLFGSDMKCGDSTKTKDGKCGDKSVDKTKSKDGKCGEGKCGDKNKAKGKQKDGKCGEGKCGDNKDKKKK